jgi:hypothetical protein
MGWRPLSALRNACADICESANIALAERLILLNGPTAARMAIKIRRSTRDI